MIVIGSPVFRYYPWIPGDYLPKNARLIAVMDDPYDAAKAPIGNCLISDSRLALKALLARVAPKKMKSQHVERKRKARIHNSASLDSALSAQQVFDTISPLTPKHYVIANESPSNLPEFRHSEIGTIKEPDSYYFPGSGGLGWGMPASVGLALAEQHTGRKRPVILIIGDGSFQYSVQAIWTAVQHKVHLIIIALRNEEYGILKSFAKLEQTPNVPGLDLPDLDLVSIAQGYGAQAYHANTIADIKEVYSQALNSHCVTVIQIQIAKKIDGRLGEGE